MHSICGHGHLDTSSYYLELHAVTNISLRNQGEPFNMGGVPEHLITRSDGKRSRRTYRSITALMLCTCSLCIRCRL